MTITTRDKILLGVLAVILFVGMMYLYGIMPANEEADDLAADISEKQAQLSQLQAQIAGINISALDAEYDVLLEYYYTTKAELEGTTTLPDKLGKVAIERMVVDLLDRSGIEGYNTLNWNITEEQFTQAYESYNANYYIAMAVCPTSFRSTPDAVYGFINTIRDDPFFALADIAISYTTETTTQDNPDDPDNPIVTTTPIAEGSFTLVYYMKARTAQADVPALMGEVTGLASEGATLTFSAVENAVEYEFYAKLADGTYALVENLTVKDNGAETYSVTFGTRQLEAGTYDIVVRAVGDKTEGWYKSPVPDADTAYATVTVA